MKHTAKALNNGFLLFINPMIDIEQDSPYIDASILITLSVVPDSNAFALLNIFHHLNLMLLTPVSYQCLIITQHCWIISNTIFFCCVET